ncbi:glutamate [NMDA] receptor subunit 1 [Toxorhynchites rutilus septentrionalis]|uniref:glutamate [NMDA] receptor subunit 1 n=1 Tax=Toxorhynchites rutilus septentrionalis TaxID=329112 RepID=UPI0024783471|nr:glutamate [NMDA] receptor subunit 1 [Toxorhynchites rutilus septentrionalis]
MDLKLEIFGSLCFAVISNLVLKGAESSSTSFDENGNLIIGLAIVHEREQPEVRALTSQAIRSVLAKDGGISIYDYYIAYNRDRVIFTDNEELCTAMRKGVTILLDFTWTDSSRIMTAADNFNIPYVHADVSSQTLLKLMENYLRARGANDVVHIFDSTASADAAIFFLITESQLRTIIIDQLNEANVERIRSIRPYPSYFSMIASTKNMNSMFKKSLAGGLVAKPDKWNLMFSDVETEVFEYHHRYPTMSQLITEKHSCCRLLNLGGNCTCPAGFKPWEAHLQNVVTSVLNKVHQDQFPLVSVDNCSLAEDNMGEAVNASEIFREFRSDDRFWIPDGSRMVRYNLNISIWTSTEDDETKAIQLGTIRNGRVIPLEEHTIKSTKRYFRVGTTESIPWAYRQRDPVTNEIVLDEVGNPIWEGYCIDFLQQLSEVMSFDYDLVSPVNGTFGQRDKEGNWNGLVGDLVVGEIDFAMASMKMTAEREEVVDFVAPYFEQTGILIVMRKPVRETSLFKFMTVLRLEVWLSILLAIIVTAIMLWLLDKFSPYSAKNNKDAYPYECRDFTLKESFWFALTSFTPQGGGEAPKALSGRTLVAAYWLFVVLMLATFTANLAAFLTVERMQTPVQSLEQLSRQSRIKYTVLKDSDTHDYFKNMKNAEDVLYEMWRNLTLSSGNDQAQYRVWDYPIKEQYINILAAIDSANPVATAEAGFRRVNEHLEADFAFVHDSAEVKYEISRNCNLTEVGEVFAEQPYAIAVQQGSHLQDELSYYILELQKERYFESLTAKFWNNSKRGVCPNMDDSEGITLESLGGVFIATLVGLALAMITLAGEVLYYRRRDRLGKLIKVGPVDNQLESKSKKKHLLTVSGILETNSKNNLNKFLDKKLSQNVTIGSKFVPASEKQRKINYISVFPRKPIH